MATLAEIRKNYPMYSDLSDQDLADKLHAKYYSDLPKETFYSKIGFSPANVAKTTIEDQTNEKPDLNQVMKQLGVPSPSNIGFGRQVSESVQNIGRGALNTVEGFNELLKSMTGSPEELKKYHENVDRERKFYEENMPAAKNQSAAGSRFIGENLPFAAPIAETVSAAKLLPRLLKGAATGGLIGGSQYVGEDGSRLFNTLLGSGIGTAIPLAGEVPGAIKSIVKGVTNKISPLFMKTEPFRVAVEKAENNVMEARNTLNKAREAAQAETGKTSTGALKYAIKKGNEKLAAAPAEMQAPETNFSPEKLKEYEDRVAHAEAEHAKAMESFNEAKEAAQAETGKSSIPALQYGIKSAEEKMAEIKTPETIASQEKVSQAENEHAANLSELNDAKAERQQIQNQLDEHLGKGQSHAEIGGHRANEIISAKKKEIGADYDKIEKDLDQKNVTIKDNEESKNILDHIRESLKKTNDLSPEGSKLEQALTGIKDDANIPARRLLSIMRTTRDYAAKLRNKQFGIGVDDETRLASKEHANSLEQKVEEIRPILKKVMGTDNAKIFEKANGRWSKEIAPIQRNRIYNQIRFGELLPDNPIRSLRGSFEGNPELRDIIKNDPELVKRVIAQRYESKPSSIHNPNELTSSYLDKLPELKDLLTQHSNATSRLEQAEKDFKTSQANLKAQNAEHEKNLKLAEESSKKQSDLKSDVELNNKHIDVLKEKLKSKRLSLQEKIKTENELKEQKKIQADLMKQQKAIPTSKIDIGKLKQDLAEYNQHLKIIEDQKNNYNLSLAEHVKVKKEYDDLMRKQQDATNLLKKALYLSGAGYAVSKGIDLYHSVSK
jgi:hypothetical protein